MAILCRLLALSLFASRAFAFTPPCVSEGSAAPYIPLCAPLIGSTGWGTSMNNNIYTLDAKFSTATSFGGHAHTGLQGQGPQLLTPALSATNSPTVGQCLQAAAANQFTWGACSGGGGSGTITQVGALCTTGACESIAIGPGQALSFAGNVSVPTEGWFLPSAANGGTCLASSMGEGQLCWDRALNTLWIGTGSLATTTVPRAPIGGVTDASIPYYDGTLGSRFLNSNVTIVDGGAGVNAPGNSVLTNLESDDVVVNDSLQIPLIATEAALTTAGQIGFSEADEVLYAYYGGAPIAIGGATWRYIDFLAGSFTVDGTYCTQPAVHQINGGVRPWTVQCADNNSSEMQFHISMPGKWDATAEMTFAMSMENENAAPSGNAVFSMECACFGAGDVYNNASWGAATTSTTVAFGTRYQRAWAVFGNVEPGIGCGISDDVHCKINVVAGSTTTQMGDVYIIDIAENYKVTSSSE